jgi:tetratricopeptide (TPR) repeat protein
MTAGTINRMKGNITMTNSTKTQEQTSQLIIFPELAIRMVETITPKSLGFIATKTFLTIANAQLANGDTDAAITTARKAMDCIVRDKSKLADEVSSRIGNYKKLGEFLIQYGTKTDILNVLDIHESTFGNLKDSFIKMSDFLYRAEPAYYVGDEKRTDSLLEKSVKIIKQVKKVQNQIDLYQYVIRTFNKLGREKQATILLEQIMFCGQETLIKSMIPGFSREQVLVMIGKIADDEKKRYECYKTAAKEFAQIGQLEDAEFFYEKVCDSILQMEIDKNSLFELSIFVQNTLDDNVKSVASKAFNEAEKWAKILGTFIPLTEFNFFIDSDDFKRAELALERITKDYRTQSRCCIRLAARYFCLGKAHEAIRILSNAETAADCCTDRNSQLRFYQVIGLYWFILREPEKGKVTFEKSRQEKLYYNYPMELTETLLFQIQTTDRDGALAAIDQTIKLAKKMKPTPNREELKVHALICELLLRCGEVEQAKQIFEKHAVILAEKPRSSWPEDFRRSDFAKAIVCKLINTFPLEQFLLEIDKTNDKKCRYSELQLLM